MLMTRTPAWRAVSIPVAMSVSQNEHSPLAQLPGSSARMLTIVALKATPIVFTPFRPPAATELTAVPWPPSSLTPRPAPVTSPLAGSILPANSNSAGLMPESMIPIFMPWPVAPAL
jgi:hypothetical protein